MVLIILANITDIIISRYVDVGNGERQVKMQYILNRNEYIQLSRRKNKQTGDL